MCKSVLKKARQPRSNNHQPNIISRDKHSVSRQYISKNALKVLSRLNKAGYDAYLVGGGVRDLLLDLKPKDFDIATNATPEQVNALFRNCRLIGRRFRLAHILFGRDIIEVATFRGHHDHANNKEDQKISKQNEQGMLLRDNIYGSIEEDAERRDFTINALYYSAKDFNIYDFANGIDDIKKKQIRLIGDPETRYREDPVRMLRAIRFATKLDMSIEPATEAPIKTLSPLMTSIPPARMFEEFLKMFMSGKAKDNFQQLRHYQLFSCFFPIVEQFLTADEPHPYLERFINLALNNTDHRINTNQRVTPAFLLAAMLWYPLAAKIKYLNEKHDLPAQDVFFMALDIIMSEQQRSVSIPKRFQAVMKDIWILQEKLTRREGKRAYKALEHPKFRAGFDFLLLRAEIEQEPTLLELSKWWQDFQHSNVETQQMMIKSVAHHRTPRAKNIRKRKKPQKPIARDAQ